MPVSKRHIENGRWLLISVELILGKLKLITVYKFVYFESNNENVTKISFGNFTTSEVCRKVNINTGIMKNNQTGDIMKPKKASHIQMRV